MNFLKALFFSKEVKNANTIIDTVGRRFNQQYSIDRSMAWNIVAEDCKNDLIRNKKLLISTLRDKKMSIHSLVYGVIIQHCRNKIMNGHFHVYRGTLNQTGTEIYNLFVFVWKLALERNEITEDIAKASISQLNELIADAG